MKVAFLPKNTTSRLQPLDAWIIQSFKSKYRKKLMRYVIARVKEDLLASEIAKQIDVLQAIIEWMAKAWKEVTAETIKNCFAKCGFTEETSEIEDDIVNEKFNALSKNSQISIVKQLLRNTLILMSKHAVQFLQSTQIQ